MTDGQFAVWDPARNYWRNKVSEEWTERPPAYVFSPKEVWMDSSVMGAGSATDSSVTGPAGRRSQGGHLKT
jgi:hypothetical protein